jgi:response regulator RpfG family c-di-GMP phosphodiesterase
VEHDEPRTASAGVIAIFNTSQDATEILRIFLEQAGYVVVTAYTHDVRDGSVDLEKLVRQYKPHAIVYDIALPYDINWRLFETIRASPACAGIPFVLTTTNIVHVRKIAGDLPVHEIIGKPYDLEVLRTLIEQAVRPDQVAVERRS